MKNSALTSRKTRVRIRVSDFERGRDGWLLDGEIRQHSQTTQALRGIILGKLVWFLQNREYPDCGTLEIKQFLAYRTRGHAEPGGIWGNSQLTGPVRPSTVQTYHRHLRAFFRWMVAEEMAEDSPIESVPLPIARPDQIQLFTKISWHLRQKRFQFLSAFLALLRFGRPSL